MKRMLLAAVLAGTTIAGSQAKEFQLPSAKPAVRITLPDGWRAEDIDGGVQATSPDGSVHIAAATAAAKDLQTVVNDDIRFLQDNGVTLDPSSQKQQQAQGSDGAPAFLWNWNGRDRNEPANVGLTVIKISDTLVLRVTTWASPNGEQRFGDQLDAALDSIRRM